jgi:hypothetical protein
MPTIDRSFRTLGTLWVLFGILCALGAVWLVMSANSLHLMWGALLNRVPDPYSWMRLFNVVLLAAIILMIATPIFSIMAAIALMQQGGPARTWPIVAAVLGVMCSPIGIALGVYTLVLFLQRPPGPAYARVPAAA